MAQVAYRLEGEPDQPVVVLSNSLGTTMAMWDDQMPALAERFRVLRYDQRGHGGSPATPGPYTIEQLGNDVVDLLDGLGLERVSFCGLSLGAMTGIWLAASVPSRVDRLVLASSAASLLPKERWTERAALARAGGLRAVAASATTRWFTPSFATRRPDVVARFAAMIASTSAEGYAGCTEAIRDLDLRDELARIRAPTLVLTGSEDPSTTVSDGEAVAAGIPRARFEVIRGAAHLVNVEQPALFGRAVLAHLADAPRPARVTT